MPPGHSKGKMLFHGFTQNDTVRVVVFKSKRILTVGAFVTNDWDIFKDFAHSCSSLNFLKYLFDGRIN